MRKSDLLKAIPEEWPKENMARIIRSGKEKVLMILLPNWDNKSRYPRTKCRLAHFLSEKRWLTYYDGSWSQESIYWLSINSHVYDPSLDDKSRKAIAEFTGMLGTIPDVEHYEICLATRKKTQALDRKQERINNLMKSTPALPGDFRKWCEGTLGDQKKINVKLFQPLNDGKTIERIFKVERSNGWYKGHYNSDFENKMVITELCRAYTDTYGDVWNKWYYGEYYNGYGNRQRFWDKKSGSVCSILPQKHYVYDNLDELDMTPTQRSTLRIMSGYADPSCIINMLHFHPEMEQIAKTGMVQVAAELYHSNIDSAVLNIKALSKEQRRKLIAVNGGLKTMEFMLAFPRITDRNLKEFAKIKSEEKAKALLNFAGQGYNMNHLMNLWRSTGGIKQDTLREFKDYLEMAERLGHNPHEEIIYRNKNWREWHNRYAEEINRETNKKKAKEDNRKYSAISKDYKRNKALFEWTDREFTFIVPKNAEAINREGRLQHHCVGTLGYKDKMARRESFIIFMRYKDDPETPYYTIECTESQIIQFYAEYDRQPDKEKVSKVLAKWMKQVKKNVRAEKKALKAA